MASKYRDALLAIAGIAHHSFITKGCYGCKVSQQTALAALKGPSLKKLKATPFRKLLHRKGEPDSNRQPRLNAKGEKE